MYGKKHHSGSRRDFRPSETHPEARFLGVKDPDFVLPGFGSHYRSLTARGSLKHWNKRDCAKKGGAPQGHRQVQGRWLNTQRRGGTLGRDHQRRLPLKPF